jgi:hypothetical protein
MEHYSQKEPSTSELSVIIAHLYVLVNNDLLGFSSVVISLARSSADVDAVITDLRGGKMKVARNRYIKPLEHTARCPV